MAEDFVESEARKAMVNKGKTESSLPELKWFHVVGVTILKELLA